MSNDVEGVWARVGQRGRKRAGADTPLVLGCPAAWASVSEIYSMLASSLFPPCCPSFYFNAPQPRAPLHAGISHALPPMPFAAFLAFQNAMVLDDDNDDDNLPLRPKKKQGSGAFLSPVCMSWGVARAVREPSEAASRLP